MRRDYQQHTTHIARLLPGHLRPIEKIRGAIFGAVWRAKYEKDGASQMVAAKCISRGSLLRQKPIAENAWNEIHASMVLRESQIPFIVDYFGAVQDDSWYYILMEYCGGGELLDVLNKLKRITRESQLRRIVSQLLICVRALHQRGVVHRDISLENILLADDSNIRLCDFGQALLVHPARLCAPEALLLPDRSALSGKPEYRAPEISASSLPYSSKAADIYACGVVLFTLVTGMYPSTAVLAETDMAPEQRDDPYSVMTECLKIIHRGTVHGASLSPPLIDVLENMLALDPARRASAADLLSHPWLIGSLNCVAGSTPGDTCVETEPESSSDVDMFDELFSEFFPEDDRSTVT